MNTLLKKMIVFSSFVISGSIYAATVQELLAQEKRATAILEQYWIDENGNTRIGGKDANARFAFTAQLLQIMTIQELQDAMNDVLSQLTAAQRNTFNNAIARHLEQLKTVKTQLDAERKKLDTDAMRIATKISIDKNKVLTMSEQNIKNLINDRVKDATDRTDLILLTTDFAKRRASLNIEIIDSDMGAFRKPVDSATDLPTQKLSRETITAKQKLAQGVANTNFKISGMVGFVGETIKYSLCADRHFDIVPDSEGLQFISIAK